MRGGRREGGTPRRQTEMSGTPVRRRKPACKEACCLVVMWCWEESSENDDVCFFCVALGILECIRCFVAWFSSVSLRLFFLSVSMQVSDCGRSIKGVFFACLAKLTSWLLRLIGS